jgi:hypothetical protein
MNDACGMRGVQCVRDLHRHRQQRLHFHRPARDQVLERYTIQKLHHYEWMPFVLGNLVDCADIGMVQRGGSPRFTAKSL